jgi:hypothetical protein
MEVLMQHENHGLMHVYSHTDVEEHKKHGWVVLEKHPAEKAPKAGLFSKPKAEAKVEAKAEDDREGLIALADAQGVTIDNRWSTERIKKAIEDAQ